jgi:hypothetical protein
MLGLERRFRPWFPILAIGLLCCAGCVERAADGPATAVATQVIAEKRETAVFTPTLPPTPSPTVPSPTPRPTETIPPAPSPATPDQQATPFTGGLWSVRWLAPIGQEFRPTLPNLNGVTLWVDTGESGENISLQIQIYSASDLLASSESVTIPPAFAGEQQFVFPSSVRLEPGILYALEIHLVAGENSAIGWTQHGGWDDPYPEGRAIVLGQPVEFANLWFLLDQTP